MESILEFLKRVKDILYWDREPGILNDNLDELIRKATTFQGTWIPVDEKEDAFDCSVCDAMVQRRYNFWPKCGAEMDVER